MAVTLLVATLSFLYGASLAVFAVDIVLRLQQTRQHVFFTVYDVPRQSLEDIARKHVNGWEIVGMNSIGKVGTLDVTFQATC